MNFFLTWIIIITVSKNMYFTSNPLYFNYIFTFNGHIKLTVGDGVRCSSAVFRPVIHTAAAAAVGRLRDCVLRGPSVFSVLR